MERLFVQMFNVQKLISFILLFYLYKFFTCSALLCLTFILHLFSSLLCFYKFLIYFFIFNNLV